MNRDEYLRKFGNELAYKYEKLEEGKEKEELWEIIQNFSDMVSGYIDLEIEEYDNLK